MTDRYITIMTKMVDETMDELIKEWGTELTHEQTIDLAIAKSTLVYTPVPLEDEDFVIDNIDLYKRLFTSIVKGDNAQTGAILIEMAFKWGKYDERKGKK
jgi:hypothetical protein